jgi:hypothetical protein
MSEHSLERLLERLTHQLHELMELMRHEFHRDHRHQIEVPESLRLVVVDSSRPVDQRQTR